MKKRRIRELYQQYVGGLSDWQIKLALGRLRHFRIPQSVWEDLMQELAMVILEFEFDPHKARAASEETILCRLLDNRIRTLARSHARRMRMVQRLEQMAGPTEDDRGPEDAAVEAEVRQLVGRLSPLQQKICRLLMDGESLYAIARITGRDYNTICRHFRRIREAFAGEEGSCRK